MIQTEHGSRPDGRTVVAIDLEWTKNYSVKNGNRPFCYSLVYVSAELPRGSVEKQLTMGVSAGYAESPADEDALLKAADNAIGQAAERGAVIVGHQLCADIGVALNACRSTRLPNFEALQRGWRARKENNSPGRMIFDTRYDMGDSLEGKSRRLVDVCQEYRLGVAQPELRGSMTRMQNRFLESGDCAVMEKLAVLNIRHSLSTALLYLHYARGSKPGRMLNVNRVLHRELRDVFGYVNSPEFAELI